MAESPLDLGPRCGNSVTPPRLRKDFGVDKVSIRAEAATTPIVVNTYFHIVANSTRVSDGYLTNSTILAQFNVLHNAFLPSGILLNFIGYTRTVNKIWATSIHPSDHLLMKKYLRRGDYSTLNIYFRTVVGVYDESPNRGLLGLCTLPWNYAVGSDPFWDDGCMVLHTTVPGGTDNQGYNMGITTVHEVGHWMGLSHTFEGGCLGGGDFVADTPAEKDEARGCPVGRDTCPGRIGVDPVNNYMDYMSDACRDTFTVGQAARMRALWNLYRA
ncbi:metalloprotease 1 precursor [Immersiella caudata]|uniref:Metalloprotease 1 n=1 Tax=Immersiella caudata TaxID=314043 RepID=A0AA39U855_9PEZI|nr:metalloprotease 1 precursor [Immersiella caudata]